MEELQRRSSENLLRTYVPNKKAEEFISHVGNLNFLSLFLAGNGVGKSSVGANIIANICFGAQDLGKNSRWKDEWGAPPKTFYNYPLFTNYPFKNKRIRIASDPNAVKEKIVPELKKWFPSNRFEIKYETYKEGKSYESKWITDTGFTIDIMSYEQAPKEFESVDCDVIWFDEPPPKAIYMASVARLRTGGLMLMTLTPLFYSAWIKDEIYDKQIEKEVKIVEAEVWDNCEDIPGTRGILKRVDIDNMVKQYPEEEKEARIRGKFGHLLGRVHKIFTERIHVIKPFKITKDDYIVVMAHDTHPRVPDAIVWMAIDRKNTKYLIDELWIEGKDSEIAAKIKMKEDYWRLERHLLDPSGFNEDKRTDLKSFASRMGTYGIFYYPGSKDLTNGIRITNESLQYQEVLGKLIIPPEVFVFESCPRTIKEFNTYVWDEFKGFSRDEKDPKPRPKDKDDHFMECVHRLLIEDFRWYPYQLETETKAINPFELIKAV